MEGNDAAGGAVRATGLIRAAATVNGFAAAVLALKVLVQIGVALFAGGGLFIAQGDVLLQAHSAPVWLARAAVILCAAAAAVALWKARVAARSGEDRAMARACLLGAAGGILAALPGLGSLLSHLFADELDAPMGAMALRFLTQEPFAAPLAFSTPEAASVTTYMDPSLGVLELLWLWPLFVTVANVAARAFTPSLTGALDPQDRRRALRWLLPVALVGAVLPFFPTSASTPDSDYAARRYVRAVLGGTPPAESKYYWADCPPALRRYSATDLSQITPPPASPAAKIRIAQRMVTGPGAAANLQQYQFTYTEQGATASATWLVITLEITLEDGSTRTVTLALSKYPGE